MDLNNVRNFVGNQLNKSQKGYYIQPDKFNVALQNINLSYAKFKYGLPENYTFHEQNSAINDATIKSRDDLRHLQVVMGGPYNNISFVIEEGKHSIPSDYWHYSSVRYYIYNSTKKDYDVKTVEEVNDFKWSSRIGNPNRTPTNKEPICKFGSDHILFHPRNLINAEFTYLRLPNTPFFDYDMINGEVVYLPPGSTHSSNIDEIPDGLSANSDSRSIELDWPDDTHDDICNLLIESMSKVMRDSFSLSVSQSKKNNGI